MSKKNSIWVGILHMGLGTVLAQMINIVVQPILTRIFPTETLGIYTYLICNYDYSSGVIEIRHVNCI
mgnify:CR=1 FL=1